MNEIVINNINYNQFIDRYYLKYDDKYNLISFIKDDLRATMLNCPSNQDVSKTALQLALDGDVVVGRRLLYSTKIKIDKSYIYSQATGSAEIYEAYRGKGIGSRMRDYTLNNCEYDMWLFSLLSPSCLSIMRKKENACTIFDFPEYVKIINTEAAFACRGIKGLPLKFLKAVGNMMVRVLDIPNKLRIKRLKRSYYVKKERVVPEWAGEMCLNDGHKYAEYHDTKWLQWCLDYNLSGHNEDIQSFYAIYNRWNQPVGFFMTKERRRDDIKTCRMVNGTLCEWASTDANLSEADINLLALETFSRDCYRILTVTDSTATEKALRRIGFIKHGYMQMGFKDKRQQYADMHDMSLWRIRFGCCNSILY